MGHVIIVYLEHENKSYEHSGYLLSITKHSLAEAPGKKNFLKHKMGVT